MRRKLTLYIFLIAAAAVMLSTVLGITIVRCREVEGTQRALYQLLSFMDADGAVTDMDRLLRQFEQSGNGLRLTFIDGDGKVLGDTERDTEENHAGRPEVVQAREQGVGEDVRHSATTGKTMVYVAMRFEDGIVGRAAQPIASVDALALQWGAVFVAGGLLALVLALLLSRKLAADTVKPVEDAQVAVAQVGETLQNARSEFTANVTHELKTPLTSIKGFTDMMASGLVTDPEDEKRFLSMISVEVERLTSLVDDILKVSELETVAGVTGTERADLLAVAQEAARMLQPQAERRQIQLKVEGEHLEGCITPDRFKEVALNLMENAVKYNRPGGRVTACVAKERGRVTFVVSDTGIGIPEECQSHVFERFYRVDKGRSRAAGGTGLGLAIVKHIVALYGGEIRLASVVGSGTTITVTLPQPGN